MIRNNLIYKIFALGLALVLWTYVNSERNPQSSKTLVVPIQMLNKSNGYIYELAKNDVRVKIQGSKTVVDSINKEDINASVDLANLKSDSNVKVNARIAELTDNIEVEVNPIAIGVKIEPLKWKRLPVEVKFLSAPPLGYSYSEPIITPASVSMSGKNAVISAVKRVILALSDNKSSGSINGEFEVTPLDAAGNVVDGVTLVPSRVRLKLDFVEVPATKTVIISANVTGEPLFPARVSRVSVVPSTVTLEGKPSSLLDVSTISTENISIDNETSTISREVGLRVPPDVRVVGRNTVRVTVTMITQPQ